MSKGKSTHKIRDSDDEKWKKLAAEMLMNAHVLEYYRIKSKKVYDEYFEKYEKPFRKSYELLITPKEEIDWWVKSKVDRERLDNERNRWSDMYRKETNAVWKLSWKLREISRKEKVKAKYTNNRIALMILKYKEHRRLKEWDKADAIRDELKAENIQIRVDKDGKVSIKDLDDELFWW